MRITRPASALAAIAVVALVLPATASHAAAAASRHRDAAVHVVASFDPAQGQNPENLAIAPATPIAPATRPLTRTGSPPAIKASLGRLANEATAAPSFSMAA